MCICVKEVFAYSEWRIGIHFYDFFINSNTIYFPRCILNLCGFSYLKGFSMLVFLYFVQHLLCLYIQNSFLPHKTSV